MTNSILCSFGLFDVTFHEKISAVAQRQQVFLEELDCHYKEYYYYGSNYRHRNVSLEKLSAVLSGSSASGILGFGARGNYQLSGAIARDSFPDVRVEFFLDDSVNFDAHIVRTTTSEAAIGPAVSAMEGWASQLVPRYGFGILMRDSADPVGYVGGSSRADSEEISAEEIEERRRWMHELCYLAEKSSKSELRSGRIRDVYFWNVFASNSPRRGTNGELLYELVEKSGDRLGRISHVGDWLVWRVPESLLQSCKAELKETGVLFDHT